jgi:hypothetical protein
LVVFLAFLFMVFRMRQTRVQRQAAEFGAEARFWLSTGPQRFLTDASGVMILLMEFELTRPYPGTTPPSTS